MIERHEQNPGKTGHLWAWRHCGWMMAGYFLVRVRNKDMKSYKILVCTDEINIKEAVHSDVFTL